MSIGIWIYYGCCVVVGCMIAHFTHPDARARFKWWVVRMTTPWHEEAASLDLAWRVFARKHNTAGKRPICHYDGWEADLDPDEKADVYELPNGDPGATPDCLQKAYSKKHNVGKKMAATPVSKEQEEAAKKAMTLNHTPGQVPR